jgi:hypothetical protein
MVYFHQGDIMGTKVKPVQPTVIKDKSIIEQVINEIRRRPTKAALARQKKIDEKIIKMFKQ